MIKCKQALEASACGRNICCLYCDLKDTCKDVCVSLSTDCGDAFEEENTITVMKQDSAEVIKAVANLAIAKKEIEKQEKEMRAKLLEAMEKYGVEKFDSDTIKVIYVKPSTRTSVDSTKLKKELPDVYAKYSKSSNVSASVRIEVKE